MIQCRADLYLPVVDKHLAFYFVTAENLLIPATTLKI